jgi:hypothetical protein
MKHCSIIGLLNVLLPRLRINLIKFLINTISVDYLDPLNFRRYNLIHNLFLIFLKAATLLQRSLKDSDYQAHFTAAFNLLLP